MATITKTIFHHPLPRSLKLHRSTSPSLCALAKGVALFQLEKKNFPEITTASLVQTGRRSAITSIDRSLLKYFFRGGHHNGGVSSKFLLLHTAVLFSSVANRFSEITNFI